MLSHLLLILAATVLMLALRFFVHTIRDVATATGERSIHGVWAVMNRGQRRFAVFVGVIASAAGVPIAYAGELLGVRISEILLNLPTATDPPLIVAAIWPNLLAASLTLLAIAVWWLEQHRKRAIGG